MKKTALCLMTTCLLLAFHPLQSKATSSSTSSSYAVSKASESAEAKGLLIRLSEINTMDKSSLTSSDKKNLRTEVLSIRNHLRELGGGVYISVGAIIIIVLLLIILL